MSRERLAHVLRSILGGAIEEQATHQFDSGGNSMGSTRESGEAVNKNVKAPKGRTAEELLKIVMPRDSADGM